MLKIIACLILSMAIFAQPICYAETNHVSRFVFMNDIYWDSTPEEAEAVLGSGAVRECETVESVGDFISLWLENTSYAGYACDKIGLMFYNNKLFSIVCYYAKSDLGDTQNLIDGLKIIYGEGETPDERVKSLSDFVSGTQAKHSWSEYENTEIEVVQFESADATSTFRREDISPYLCFVSFNNIPNFKLFEEAINNALALE